MFLAEKLIANTVAARFAFAYHGAMAVCYRCGAALPERKKIFRSTRCESCGADLRVCRNCEFYAPEAHWECRETIPEPVREKEQANFCDYFRPATGKGKTPADDKSEQARDDFQQLFGGE